MFLHVPTLKKLMKNAYNNGNLTVGMIGNGLIIGCATVYIWLEKNTVSNKIKAAIMELAGELPTDGVTFTASKDGNQMYLPWNEVYDVKPRLIHADKRYIVTPIIYGDSKYDAFRFLQQCNNASNIKTVHESFMSLIDPAEIDYEHGEGGIQGPYSSELGSTFYWSTDLCVLGIPESKLSRGLSRQILNSLTSIHFDNDYSGLED